MPLGGAKNEAEKEGDVMKRLDREIEGVKKNEKLIARIQSCMDSPETNDWEEDFLQSIYNQVMDGKTLTDAQMDKFDQVEDIAINGRTWD